MYISSNVSNMSFSPLLFDQVDISISGQTGESGTNGVLANMIPKSGGNAFRGSLLANGSGPGLQASNITQRLIDRGLAGAPTSLKKLYDVNGAIGGPIKKDTLWFYFTSRYFTNESYIAGLFYPVDPAAVVRTEDKSHQANLGTWTRDNNLRLTWAMSQKSKISAWYAYQRKQDPFWTINATLSPEAARVTEWYTQLGTLTWTYTATNRLLFEVGRVARREPRHDSRAAGPAGRHPDRRAGDGDQPAGEADDLPRLDGVGHVRQRAPAELQSVGQLRDRDAQRQGRDGSAARAFQPEQLRQPVQRHPDPDAGLRPEPGDDLRAAGGLHEPAEPQPGHLRAGSVDAEPA